MSLRWCLADVSKECQEMLYIMGWMTQGIIINFLILFIYVHSARSLHSCTVLCVFVLLLL